MKKVYAHFRLNNLGVDTGVQRLHHSGGITVYGEWNDDTHQLRAMGAICTVEDNYSYKLGRTIAEGRFNKHRLDPASTWCGQNCSGTVYEWSIENERDIHERLNEVARDLSFRLRVRYDEFALKRYYRSTGEFEK